MTILRHGRDPVLDPGPPTRVSVLISDPETELEAPSIVICDELAGTTELKGPATELKLKKAELLDKVRSGKHVELVVQARTYRQRKGHPNRRFLRFADGQLEAIAASFKGQPFLIDHNTWELSARKGTILDSKLIADSRGMSAFEMTFSVVKPDAVIGVLDGTLDRFSIGWFPVGPVLCSVHKTDVRSANACNCWPGDRVEVDGKAQIVEYEFQSAEGKEVSGVNVPAVKGTGIDDIRAALTAELSLPPKRKERVMDELSELAAALGFESAAALTANPRRAVSIVEGLRRDATAARQEAGELRTQLTDSETARKAAVATANKTRIDTLLAGAYSAGKLRYGRDEEGKPIASRREERLRAIAARDGIDALAAEIAELEVVVPVGERQVTGRLAEPERTETGVLSAADNPYLEVAARELGIPIEELKANARLYGTGV